MTRDCGSCKHFVKWKADQHGGGICLLKDVRTKTDHGRGCEEFKRKKFVRSKA